MRFPWSRGKHCHDDDDIAYWETLKASLKGDPDEPRETPGENPEDPSKEEK